MKILKHQIWNLLCLLLLLAGVKYFIDQDPKLMEGELWGIDTSIWFLLAILSPILHQLYVLLCWRLELHHQSISNTFGANGFKIFKIGFALLILSRPVTIVLLSISNMGTLEMNQMMANILALILFIPAAYLFYSVKKYFGQDRAFGIDHFEPNKFKNEPFIRKGIFKYSSNAMYVFGFFLLYTPGLLLLSKAAIVVAVFNHLYIWVHYYFTEAPNMKLIYGD